MNNIKSLMQEAGLQAYYDSQQRDIEKFAELIIQECIEVAQRQRNPANLNYQPSQRFVEDLQQHFGVK